jgi:hypothetical protein
MFFANFTAKCAQYVKWPLEQQQAAGHEYNKK